MNDTPAIKLIFMKQPLGGAILFLSASFSLHQVLLICLEIEENSVSDNVLFFS